MSCSTKRSISSLIEPSADPRYCPSIELLSLPSSTSSNKNVHAIISYAMCCFSSNFTLSCCATFLATPTNVGILTTSVVSSCLGECACDCDISSCVTTCTLSSSLPSLTLSQVLISIKSSP